MGFDEISVGHVEVIARTITREDIVLFAKVSGDSNPVHLDDEYAKKTRFGQIVAHGMLSASFISAMFGSVYPGPGCIYLSQNLTFLKPVFVGSEIFVKVEVLSKDSSKRRIVFKTQCIVEGSLVIDGSAVIYVP